jgi:hypothetical protein
MGKCKSCGKGGLFLELRNGLCFSCFQIHTDYQLEVTTSRIRSLSQDNSKFREKLDALTSNIASLEQEKSEFHKKLDELTSNIASLEEEKAKILAIRDEALKYASYLLKKLPKTPDTVESVEPLSEHTSEISDDWVPADGDKSITFERLVNVSISAHENHGQKIKNPEQQDRFLRSIFNKLSVLSIDMESKCADIVGSSGNVYKVSLSKCQCADFIHRREPCKHMWLLANKLGIINYNINFSQLSAETERLRILVSKNHPIKLIGE